MIEVFLRSKYYPVNYEEKIIYNDPQDRDVDCSSFLGNYPKEKTIGVLGNKLNLLEFYHSFRVLAPVNYA